MKKNSLYVSNIITDVLKNLSLTTKDTKFLLLILKSMSKNRLFFQKIEEHYLNKDLNLKITNVFDDKLQPFIDKIDETVVFSRKEFIEITGVHHTTVNREVWSCWDNIHSAKIESLDKELYKGVSGNLFIDFNNLGNGDFKIRVTEYMKRLFALLFQYTELHLPYISVLKKHSLTMYLICKVEQKKWNKRFVEKETVIAFSLEDLKETLKVPTSYNISMLKKNVLDKIEDSFKNTDLNLRYELIKTGRKVTKINIIFSPNNNLTLNNQTFIEDQENSVELTMMDEHNLKDKLILMGISKLDSKNYIEENGYHLVKSVYDKVIKANQKNKIRSSLSGYFIKSLKNEIQIASESALIIEEQKIEREKERVKKEKKLKQTKSKKENYFNEFNNLIVHLCNSEEQVINNFRKIVASHYPRITQTFEKMEQNKIPMAKNTFINMLQEDIRSCMNLSTFSVLLKEANIC